MSRFTKTMFSNISKRHPALAWIHERTMLLNAVLLGLIIALGAAYIIQINSTVAQGYEMRHYETKIDRLSLENQRMEVEVQKAQSLDNVVSDVQMIGMVEAERPDYVNAAPASYALAQ